MMLNLDKNCNTAFHEIGITVFHKRAPLSFYHRRTCNFSPERGGDGYPFAKTFSQVTKIFTKQLKRNDGHTMHYISMVRSVSFSDYRVGISPCTVNKCDDTDAVVASRCRGAKFSIGATH